MTRADLIERLTKVFDAIGDAEGDEDISFALNQSVEDFLDELDREGLEIVKK